MGALILHFCVLGVAASVSESRTLLHHRFDTLVGWAWTVLQLGRWLGRVVWIRGMDWLGRLLELLLGRLLSRLVSLRWGLIVLMCAWHVVSDG